MYNLELGKTTKTRTPITVSLKERKQGTYVIGTTGTGTARLDPLFFRRDNREQF